jgi:hydrogenase maturation factor
VKYLDEYRSAGPARALLEQIRRTVTRPWTLMEVCGGQTHNLMKFGIDRALPAEVELVHGPGCPVCVTPLETLDRAMAIAARAGLIFATFGDMLRVPGSHENLLQVRSRGGDVRIVYSPRDAVSLARANPDRQVVFLAVGFETTAPTAAGAFEVVDYPWRGIGPIPASGMALKSRYRRFDARARYPAAAAPALEPEECRSGEVLTGRLKPSECPAFGTRCDPDHPLGATMVSAEKACAAYFRYRRPHPLEESSI